MSRPGDNVETKNSPELVQLSPNGQSKQASTFRSLFTIEQPTPPPPPPSIRDAALTPETSAGFISRLWFSWLTPLLSLGYARPLEASDLYKLPDERTSIRIANAILTSFEDRCKHAALYNERLADDRVGPGIKGLWWSFSGIRAEREKAWRQRNGKRKASLALAMNDSVKWLFWSAGILKVTGDTAQITSPLMVKAIITFATKSYGGHATGTPAPPIGTGVGLCFTLFVLQLISSWSTQHFFYRTSARGVLLRGGLISAIYSKALSLSPRARMQITNGRLVNYISTDVSRTNTVMTYFHVLWATPIQIAICLILLLLDLGPSALAGFGLLIISMPVNALFMKRVASARIRSLVWTDKRSNLLREMLSGMRVIHLDTDPLSALDANVATAVFFNILKNGTAGRTRILVTHALHFLPEVDYIYTVANGRIAEHGTFNSLIASGGAFSKFIEEFGSDNGKNARDRAEMVCDGKMHRNDGTNGGTTMQEEERNTGAIPFKVYQQYLSAGNGMVLVPIIFCSLAMREGFSIMASNWLVYWEEMKWSYPQGFYMGVYAALGVSQSLMILLTGITFALLTNYASQGLHKRSIVRVLHAPMSFFETTPLGRIMNRFCEDANIIDNLISDSLRMLCNTLTSIIGAIIFISIMFPWFLLVLLYLSLLCLCCILLSSKLKRTKNANLRSSLYAHFSESLSGSATISACGEVDRFKRENVELVDIQNRAYWLTIANQRWLGVRLDFLGSAFTFAVAIFTVCVRFSISPGRTGVILSYIIGAQQAFRFTVLQLARVENDMNSVEQIVHYANEVEEEAPHQVEDSPAPLSWPVEGQIIMNNVSMKYRPELPLVLRGLNMEIVPGEKIGIVGRTGSGKSSITAALCRLVELSSGSIHVDGVDISKVGLEQLRRGIAIIPQDTFLFSGTLRSNLDPFGLYHDARLWDALKRVYLVDQQLTSPQRNNNADTRVPWASFDLDTPIDNEGSNLSAGQRSLVSLARALVHETKILILDEATASLDYETDGKIQDTIAIEFKKRTVLCIAHRLRSIIAYDRICVLDAGTIAEFDTPVNLFNIPDGMFREMCDRSSISLEETSFAHLSGRHESGVP